MGVPDVRLTGRASRFLLMLRDFGHLDEDGVNRVILGASELLPAGGVADLDEVRRLAATVLFPENGAEGLLDADWPILFS